MSVVTVTAIWEIVGTFATAAIGAAVTYGIPLLNAKLKLSQGSQAADDLDQALIHGVALVEDVAQSVAAHNATIAVPAALETAANLVIKLAPAAVSELGITPANVATMIQGKLSPPAKAAAVVTPAPVPVAK